MQQSVAELSDRVEIDQLLARYCLPSTNVIGRRSPLLRFSKMGNAFAASLLGLAERKESANLPAWSSVNLRRYSQSTAREGACRKRFFRADTRSWLY